MAEPKAKPSECESCEAPGVRLNYYPTPPGALYREPGYWMCDLCASTDAGTAKMYPEQYPHPTDAVLKTICFVGNEILKALPGRQ